MKTTINKKELEELNACVNGLLRFTEAHGSKTVNFSEAFISNGWADIWWLLNRVELSSEQVKDLHLLGCHWVLTCLGEFEKEHPGDTRPRDAIEMWIKHFNEGVDEAQLEAARDGVAKATHGCAYGTAAYDAAMAAWHAKISPRMAAASVVSSKSVHGSVIKAIEQQEEDLLKLLLTWENQ